MSTSLHKCVCAEQSNSCAARILPVHWRTIVLTFCLSLIRYVTLCAPRSVPPARPAGRHHKKRLVGPGDARASHVPTSLWSPPRAGGPSRYRRGSVALGSGQLRKLVERRASDTVSGNFICSDTIRPTPTTDHPPSRPHHFSSLFFLA